MNSPFHIPDIPLYDENGHIWIFPGEPPKFNWLADYNLKRMEDVMNIVNSLTMFWPLSVRQYYYRVISMPGFLEKPHWLSQKGPTKGQPLKDYYGEISELLKWARLKRILPMECVNDDGREATLKVGFSTPSQYFHQETENLFKGYSACLAENQPRYIEIWIEKAGLVHIIEPVADEFCRRVFAVRGYPSVTSLNEYAQRVKDQEDPLILYFGDLDKDGVAIPETIATSLEYEHKVLVEVLRCGLNPQQAENLDASPIPLKGTAKEKREFQRHYGELAYEIEAVSPEDLQVMVDQALECFTDMEVLEADRKAGEKDAEKFGKLNEEVKDYAAKRAGKHGLIHGQ